MRTIDVKDKIRELGVELPDIESMWKMGDLTALRRDDSGKYYRSNYERGLLLYAIVAKYRPVAVLEFGTGRGYGALSMARAMEDHGIDGRIYTVDIRGYSDREDWPIDYGDGPLGSVLSWSDIWTKHFPPEWTDQIQCINENSVDTMEQWEKLGLPCPDLVFIDGGHGYETVKHDLYSALSVASDPFVIIIDDYARKLDFGVCQLIDEEVEPVFNAELICTDRRWNGGENERCVLPEHGMVFIDSANVTADWHHAFQPKQLDKFKSKFRKHVHRQRRWGRLWKLVKPLANRMGYRRATGS